MKFLLPLLLSISVAAFGAAPATTPAQLVEKLQKKYESLQSLKANFTQSYKSSRFSQNMTETGVVYFEKDGKMRWEYDQPEKKLFVSDGVSYYYYMPQEKQVIKAPMQMESGEQHSPTLFLAGRGNFLQDFRAEWSGPNAEMHLLKLTPIKPQPDFRYLITDVDPSTGLILRLVIVDDFDNRTEFAFNSIQENPRLPANFFVFHAPPGTDVIYQKGEKE